MLVFVSLWGIELIVRTLSHFFTVLRAFCRPYRSQKFWPRLLFFVILCRIGEAANPGPNHNFVLGAFNPSGLKGKAPYIVSHLDFGDLWAVSETHLCSQTLQAFKSSLQFASSQYRYCVGGHPVPSQQNRMFHSAWRGVAVLSRHPTREVPTSIPHEVYASSRAVVTSTLVHDVWITGGTVYGEPESSSYPHQKQNNETILHHVVAHVCHLARGPRYVAGDWNVLSGTLPSFEVLEAAGFRDLQDIAQEMWGQPVQNTCKNSTRKDFCYISHELQLLLRKVGVSQDVFPDHAVLWGEFHTMCQVFPKHVWAQPAPFPWPADWMVDPHHWNSSGDDCDMKYQNLWNHIETQASEALPFHVPKKAFGRACTRDVKQVVNGKVSPPKKARPGDIQPHYVCASFRHAQWLRQTRRLQAYVRYVTSHGPGNDYARQVWGAIIRATGFAPSFHEWWTHCSFRVPGAPAELPYVPPDARAANKIFDSFAMAFRSFEKELFQASRSYARQRREANPNAIFRDIQAPQCSGVDVLIKPVSATVESVRVDEGELVLDREVCFDVSRPIFCNGTPLSVVHAESDAIWAEHTEFVPVGSRVSQARFRGTDTELFSLFLDAWKAMWERHQDVPLSRWDGILNFARDKLSHPRLSWPNIDVGSLVSSISHKKTTTSGGLDGVTLADLKAMPLAAHSNFVSMYYHAEATGEWPQQVIAGRVTCIAKHACPMDALDFRPITVLGLLYRCWSTYHARQAIRAIDGLLPTGLYGSRASHHAGQVWSHLLWSIELAYEQQTSLCGIMADIQKAFNFLPRPVVMEGCALIGIPFHVLRGWAGALMAMPRRFQIRGSLSPPAYSNCGLPEGCALSCLGMMVIDILFHEYMIHFFPMCQPLSYVDDWQVLVMDPNALQPVFECLERFTQLLDLFLDQRKTHTWSVCQDGRKMLKTQGFGVVSCCRNLGAHVQYTRQHTNKALMDRIQNVHALWMKLRLSASPYAQKVRALKSAAWPKCLHAIAATTISQATYTALRAGAMKGLKADNAGANPAVHLGLVEIPTADPQCWAVMQTLQLARECGPEQRIEQVMADIVTGCQNFPANSITQTLLSRVQTLGWHVDHWGHIHDVFGKFSLFHISNAELQYRVLHQWLQVVVSATAHRPCFQGLEACDPEATRRWMSTLEVSDQALFRKVLNGTHITQDGKQCCQASDSDICPYCECTDSRFHRFWICSRFEHIRAEVPQHVFNAATHLPEALTCCGWALAPTTQQAWNQYFVNLHPTPVTPVAAVGTLHVFTDGSCFEQHCPQSRFAGWSVIQADTSAVHDFTGSLILDSGVLPGLLQSAGRAEVFAVLRALQISRSHAGEVMLWSDCDAVVKRLRKLLNGGVVKCGSSHSDLWEDIHGCLQDRRGPTRITRVAAHQNEHAAIDVFTEWCFRHNELADRQAVQANLKRPPEFWELYAMHAQARAAVQVINHAVQCLQLNISKEVVRSDEPLALEMAPIDLALPPPLRAWRPLPELRIPAQAVRWYGDALVRRILSWFWQSVGTGQEELHWVSHFQLYADYMCSTGHPGPVHLTKWADGDTVPQLTLLGLAFRQRTRWFVKVWKECLKHLGINLEFAYGRPFSQAVLMHTGCVSLPWPRDRLALVDRWMISCAQATFRRQTRAIDALPYADIQPGFPPMYQSTAGS